MLTKKYLLLFGLTLLILSLIKCNNKQQSEEEVNTEDSLTQKPERVNHNVFKDFKKINISTNYSKQLDSLLKCSDYVYVDYYFRMPDYGCVFNPDLVRENKLGWADVILFLNKKDKGIYDKYSIEKLYDIEDTLNNNYSIQKIKEDFIPAIFLIEKKHLSLRKKNEILYYPTIPYVKKLFMYSKKRNNWNLIDSIKVEKQSSDREWVNSYIDTIANISEN